LVTHPIDAELAGATRRFDLGNRNGSIVLQRERAGDVRGNGELTRLGDGFTGQNLRGQAGHIEKRLEPIEAELAVETREPQVDQTRCLGCRAKAEIVSPDRDLVLHDPTVQHPLAILDPVHVEAAVQIDLANMAALGSEQKILQKTTRR